MWSARCVLALVALHIGVVHSWDIAVSVKDQLIFYTNGIKTGTVNLISQNPTALVYDEIHNMMLYVDKQNNNDAVCGYDLSSKDNKCFIKRNGRNIHGLAFDPVTQMIFFTDTIEKSINWISLKPGFSNNVYGNLLMKIDDGFATDITVDSCRGYIYWAREDWKLERAKLNGSEREVMPKNTRFRKFSLFIDQQKKRMFYFDVCEDCANLHGYLSKNNLNMTNDHWLLDIFYGSLSKSRVLTGSKDFIYWVISSESYDSVWQLSNNALRRQEPKLIIKLLNEKALGITAKYNIEDQIKGIQDCASMSNLLPIIKVPGITDTSDNSACVNYCMQGNCSFDDKGLPKCRCNAGYSGERCEVHVCFNFCMNDGDCFLNEEEEPVCQCVGNHEGSRCKADTTAVTTNTTTSPPAYNFAKRNFSLADFLSTLRKPSSKLYLTVEVSDDNYQ